MEAKPSAGVQLGDQWVAKHVPQCSPSRVRYPHDLAERNFLLNPHTRKSAGCASTSRVEFAFITGSPIVKQERCRFGNLKWNDACSASVHALVRALAPADPGLVLVEVYSHDPGARLIRTRLLTTIGRDSRQRNIIRISAFERWPSPLGPTPRKSLRVTAESSCGIFGQCGQFLRS